MESDNFRYYQKFKSKIEYDNEFSYDESLSYIDIYKRQLRGMSIPKPNSKTSNCSKYFALLTRKPRKYGELFDIFNKIDSFKGTVSEEKLLFVYGDLIGSEKWKSYKDKQAITNSFEYKNSKFGMSLDEYKEYNKFRAVTEYNCILKHGVDKGLDIWNNYKQRQSYTNSKEYFLNECGKSEEEYLEINKKKGHNLDSYLLKYESEELALSKLCEYFSKQTLSYSKQSQKLFNDLVKESIFFNKKYYYAEHNNEYGLYDIECRKYYKYDFVCPDLKLVIEYHGDHYHGNPDIYNPSDYLKGRGCGHLRALDKWKSDDIKNNRIKIDRGFDVLIIWESDYLKNPPLVIERVLNYVSTKN
jgi:very-short-patch-repair endonuclease